MLDTNLCQFMNWHFHFFLFFFSDSYSIVFMVHASYVYMLNFLFAYHLLECIYLKAGFVMSKHIVIGNGITFDGDIFIFCIY